MGFNLGAFAGGAAQGFTTQQKMAQDQQRLDNEQGFRDRQLKMQEQDQSWQEEQRNQQRAMQADIQAVNDKYMKPQTVTSDDGTTQTVPPLDMNDQKQSARRLSYMTDMLGVKMKHTMDPTQLAPIMDYLDKARETKFGQDVLGAVSGDQDKLNGLVTQMGGDPTKAKLDHDKMTLDLGNGKPPVDLQQYLLMGGAEKALNGVTALRKEGREEQVAGAQVGHLGAQANLATQEANVAVPARAAMDRAHASYFQERGAAAAQGANDLKLSAALDKHVGQYLQPDPSTGKPDTLQKAYLTGYGLKLMSDGQKDPAKAAQGAYQQWNTDNKRADAYVSQLDLKNADKTAIKAKFGTTSPDAIKRKIMQNFAASFPAPAAAAPSRGGNLSYDPDLQ